MYQTPKKMTIKKKIAIGISILAIIWLIIFIINYIRYTNSQGLILAIHVYDDKYEDGYVEEYYSLGYTYRLYQRNAITREEFVPFWVLRENPASESDLPIALTDYEIPENTRRLDKFRGLLYYYIKSDLVGTYKCLNSSSSCEKATGGYDTYNIINKDPLTKLETQHTLGTIYDKYAFVDDSYEQDSSYGDLTYTRTIYLYQFLTEEPKIIAQYADVKESTYDEDTEQASGDNNRYIVKSKDNNKWGIIHISESGTITEVLPFEYESINYDQDTGYYIICKDNSWYVYDLNNEKIVSAESVDPIYDVWRNSNLTYYFKTGKERTVGDETFIDYKIYRIDGKEFLTTDRVTEIMERSTYIAYITSTDSILHFIDYSGEEKYKVQLAFSEMNHTELNHPAFSIYKETERMLTIWVYEGRDLKYSYEILYIYTTNWEYNDD